MANILIIDDSPTDVRVFTTLLERAGHQVVAVSTAEEGIERVRADLPDLVIMDVIMLSSKDGLFDKARGRIVGAEQYLTKPFTRDELLGAIHRHVSTVSSH